MENNENLVIIPADLPEGSYLSKAPSGQPVIMVPVRFEISEEEYRLLFHYGDVYRLPLGTPGKVACWIVKGHCRSMMRTLEIPTKDSPADDPVFRPGFSSVIPCETSPA